MTGVLLDTNVVSELTKETPESRVLAFLAGHDNLWLSAVVLTSSTSASACFRRGVAATASALCCRHS